VWFVTGSSRGFGRQFVDAALRRGDRVAATARNVASLDDLVARYGSEVLLPLALDVTDRAADFAAVGEAHDHFGRLDVVVNNAGYGLFGAVEEVSEEQVRAQFETNVFGALWVTQAALPFLRSRGSGHIVQVSSVGGVVALPNVGIYNASKWALEAFSDALSQEVAPYGIKVTIVEPSAFATDWSGSSKVVATPLVAYDHVRVASAARGRDSKVGDPGGVGPALLRVVDADDPPLRVLFGSQAATWVNAVYPKRLTLWEQWREVTLAAEAVLPPSD
jgi:NAD(P)-dependent dehydrogenase (short-subunit alcohol dehydrogenase family)